MESWLLVLKGPGVGFTAATLFVYFPGNLIRTPDARLAILDFGLMTSIDDNIKYGMIEVSCPRLDIVGICWWT